jgi:TP901 family phage tail tape measure protein
VAERTVTVRLRAVVDDYKSAMASAGRATQDVATQAGKWKNLGQSTAALGDSLTRNVTLPIVAVGAAAVKMSLDFDRSFQQMHQLAGVSASEIDGMKESVLGLAGETGKAPTELAEALYFLRSSGLGGAAAMDALEMSAKASAAGMGSTVEVADAVSSAMNAYAESNLTAAEATDVLVATAREGKAEPAELASQMGKLLPLSSELGISFQDVGAAIATLSLKGNDAAASSTLLQNVMQKLLRPSQQAQEALAGVGISVDDIRGMIAEKGLLGTLETLKSSLGDSGFTRFWEDAQAVQGALGIVGGDIDATRDRFAALNDSAGDTDEAFGKWAETMGAENAQAFAKFQVAMIRLGDVIAPIAADLAGFAAKVLEAFAKLPQPVQSFVVALAAVAAAAGPLLSVGGRLISMGASLYTALLKIAVPAGTVEGAFTGASTGAMRFSSALRGVLGAAGTLGVLAVATDLISNLVNPVDTANLSKLENQILNFAESGRVGGEAAEVMGEDLGGLADAMHRVAEPSTGDRIKDIGSNLTQFGHDTQSLEQARQTIDDVDKALASLAARDPEAAARGFERIKDAMREQGISASQTKDLFNDYAAAAAETDTASRTAAGGADEATGAFDEQATQVTEAVQALSDYVDAIAAMSDPLFGLNSALQQNRDAQTSVREAELALAQARASGNPLEVAAAEQTLTDARIAAGQSAFGVAQAEATLAAALQEQPGLIGNVNAMLDGFVAQGLITEVEARVLADRFGVLAERVESVPERAGVEVSETGAARTSSYLADVKDSAFSIPTRRNTHVTDTNTNRARVNIQSVRDAANSVPSRRNTHTGTSGTGQARSALGGVRESGISIPSRRNTHTWTSGTGPAITGLHGVRDAANGIPRNVNVTVNYAARGQAAINILNAKNRAVGGPVDAGRLYEVAEQGNAELLRMGGRSYLIPGANGTVVPADAYSGHMTAGAAMGGGVAMYNIDLRGAITPDSASLEKVVFRAIARGGERGRPLTVRGRRL